MSVADEIKSRIDIVNYIQQYVPLKKAGRYYKANCPFHSERTPSFIVNPDTQSWRCFGSCAEGGDLFTFAQKHHGWSFREALEELARQAGVELRRQTDEQRQQAARRDVLRGLLQAATDWYQERLWDTPQVLNYARGRRGFSDDTLRAVALGYAPEGWQHLRDYMRQLDYSDDDLLEVGLLGRRDEGSRPYDYFRNRLVIPIRDERGRVVGFGARALADGDQPKYLNSPQTPLFDKSRLLYGLDRARQAIRNQNRAVIVEGYMDVIQAHQAGHMNVVAQMGTSLTEPQLRLLTPRLTGRVVLALDADSAGQNATMRSLEVARQTLEADYSGRLSLDIRVLQLPDAKDPDDLIREDAAIWGQRVGEATAVADYVIEAEMQALPDSPSIQEREAVARRLLPLLMASENRLYSRDNLQKLAMRLRIAEDELLRWSQRQKTVNSRRRESVATEPEGATPSAGPMQEDQNRERDFLGNLLRQPDLIYRINRAFRELAAGDLALLRGPLEAFGAMDLVNRDCASLLQGLQLALKQDEIPVLAWLQEHGDALQRDTLQQLERETPSSDLDHARTVMRQGFGGDLPVVVKRAEAVDWQRELLRTALRLRLRRLERERRELYYLLEDDDRGKDALHERIQLSVRARNRIDMALQNQTPANR
ncbi:MAG: DNA primase [Anaerolineaceae bacterium]|nr:DNA primase [Anaerolineaceae bacterium]MDE0328427.1 DNA primase [Anaerolineaceae bacterium]